MTKIKFAKMHGLGNDFIFVEGKDLPENTDLEKLSARLCHRHFGIGADGLVIVNPTNMEYNTDTAWRIFNSDGTEPEMCGNAIRCFAKFVHDKKIIDKTEFTVSTLAGTITPKIEPSGLITVDMGEPILEPTKVPVKSDKDKVIAEPLKVLDREFNINCVSMGNPHCIIFIKDKVDATKYGPVIETHEIFPAKTNVEFVTIVSDSHIDVDVWERGCGITLACGTGACACTVAGVLNGFTERKIQVTLPGGNLIINYDEETNHVFMSGPAEYSFEGSFEL